ncbi:MAG: hypothetical protein ACM3IJ_00615 [Candidatus Levyibacteriota bacterium]
MVFIEDGRSVGPSATKTSERRGPLNRTKGALNNQLHEAKKRGINWLATTDRGHQIIHGFVDRVFTHGPERLFSWEGKEHIEELTPHIKNGEKVVLIMNHRSLADAVPGAQIQLDIRGLMPGAFEDNVYTMAGSMKSGEQGQDVQALFTYGVEPYFAKVGINPDFVVTKNDRSERGMSRPEDNGELTREQMKNTRALSAVHISGITKEGKIDPETGEPHGIQPLDRGFKGILLTQLQQGIPTVFLPVVIEGGNEYFDPVKKTFTPGGFMDMVDSLMIGEGTKAGSALDAVSKLWFGNDIRYKRGTVRIGSPKTLAEIHTRVAELENNVNRLQAELTSARYLGPYGRQLLGLAA